jgi:hypothetical protein
MSGHVQEQIQVRRRGENIEREERRERKRHTCEDDKQ